jgi:hypothetical protein
MDIAAAQHVCRTVKKVCFRYLETQNLNQDPLENIFGVIYFHCCSNSNATVGQFVRALKTSIIKGLDFSGLMGTNCEYDGTSLLDDLHSLLKVSDASPPQVTAGRTLMMFLIVSMFRGSTAGSGCCCMCS